MLQNTLHKIILAGAICLCYHSDCCNDVPKSRHDASVGVGTSLKQRIQFETNWFKIAIHFSFHCISTHIYTQMIHIQEDICTYHLMTGWLWAPTHLHNICGLLSTHNMNSHNYTNPNVGVNTSLGPVIQILCHVLALGFGRWQSYFASAPSR